MIAPPRAAQTSVHRHARGVIASEQSHRGSRPALVRRTAVGAFPLPITCTVAFSVSYWFDYRVLCKMEKLVRTNPYTKAHVTGQVIAQLQAAARLVFVVSTFKRAAATLAGRRRCRLVPGRHARRSPQTAPSASSWAREARGRRGAGARAQRRSATVAPSRRACAS